jgi:hypothetical protein
VAALAFSAAPAVSGAVANAAPAARFSYTGYAYGTSANVGSLLKSGPSAPVALGCTADAGISRTNTTAGINLAPLARSGTVFTTAETLASPVQAKTTATTQEVSLLGGLVHATLIKASSSTTRTATGFAVSADGTTFTKLVVGNNVISANPAPNTRIDIGGFGYLIVNEQRSRVGAASASLTVNGLHLVVNTANPLGVAPNTHVIVSHAVSGLSAPVAGVLDGKAYGTKANVGRLIISGPTFQATMPCLGTNGRLRENTGAGVNIGTALQSGTIRNTVQGTVTASSATGETTSTVQAANVLNGLVSATVIKADAHASTNGSTFDFSDSGSTFASLSVNGHPEIDANVAPNTKVEVAGIGTLYLHRVIRTSNKIEVRMIELVLTNAVNGLPVGANVRVAVAEASAH